MLENHAHQQFDDDEEDSSIFVDGRLLEPEELDAVIEALARDEMLQAEEARRELTG